MVLQFPAMKFPGSRQRERRSLSPPPARPTPTADAWLMCACACSIAAHLGRASYAVIRLIHNVDYFRNLIPDACPKARWVAC